MNFIKTVFTIRMYLHGLAQSEQQHLSTTVRPGVLGLFLSYSDTWRDAFTEELFTLPYERKVGMRMMCTDLSVTHYQHCIMQP